MAEPASAPGLLAADEALLTLAPQRLVALYAAARRLARAEGSAEAYQALLAGTLGACGAQTAALYLPAGPPPEPALACVGQAGEGWAPPARLLPARPWRAAVGARRPLPAGALLPPDWAPGPDATLTAVPGASDLYGLLLTTWAPGAPRPPGWEAALIALADDAGRALDQLLRRQAAARGGAGSSSQELLDALNAVSDTGLLYGNLIDRLLDAVLAQMLAALPLGGGAIYLYGQPSEQIELAAWDRGPAAAYGPDPALIWDGPALPYALAHARATAQAAYPALTVEAQGSGEAPADPLEAALQTLGAASLVSLPLLAGGWLTGVLQVVAAPGSAVTPEQVQVLRALARQAAVAIENARIFAQTRAEQERARAVVDATNDAILMIDEHRRPMLVNRRARFFFGLTERDMIGKSLDQLGGMFARIFEDGQHFNDWLGQMLRSQSERALEEFRILSPEPRLLQCYSAPVTDLHDRYRGRLLVFRDITREREVERMKNDFVSIVSHELRTPLTSIQGALQLVLGQPEQGRPGMAEGLSQRGRDLLRISRANTERLIRLINDILDIAKIEQGRIQLRREPLSAEELCRFATEAVNVYANERGIGVELQIRAGLPQVLADRDRSVQILVNLLSNAIKFSPPGQRVLLSVRQEGLMVCFMVQDWGRGIAPEHQALLFQKFHQIDSSTTRDVGGTGLGLSISKALVEELGGRMWLESQLGQGSSFSFTLPAAPGAESEAPPQRPNPEAEAAGARAHVLVVDDDPHVRPVLVRLLQRHGLNVSNASDGYGALSVVEREVPDVILLDIKMPGLDGFEVLRRLKGRPETAPIPVIILTANDLSDSARVHGLDLGAHAYLEKPITYERLISTVDAALRHSGGQP